jgi:hypothetical protein
MKYLKSFNESQDEMLLLIDDYLFEYFEKWKLKEESEYGALPFSNAPVIKKDFNGTYQIEIVSTMYFKKTGFPDGKSGYLVTICFTKDFDEKEFKEDMYKFIKRVCMSGFQYDTSSYTYGKGTVDITGAVNFGVRKYYIAFFK